QPSIMNLPRVSIVKRPNITKPVIPKKPGITPTLRMGTICMPRITLRKRASITRRSMAAKAKQAEPSQSDNPRKPGASLPAGARLSCLRQLCVGLQATAGPVHTPGNVMLNQEAESLRGRQALMPKDVDERVADAECFADVKVKACSSLRIVRNRITQAVFAAADVSARSFNL